MTTTPGTVGPAGWVLLVVTAFLGCRIAYGAPNKPEPPAAPAKEIKAERALALLKSLSDTLANAKSLSFKARSLVPFAAPTGQYVSLFASSRVVLQRPDRLFVETRGDLFPNDLYFDGKTVTAVGLDKKFYAQRPAAGATFDAIIKDENPGSDALAPFVEMLVSDPYTVLTKDLLSAIWVGQSEIGGVKTDHLAFTAQALDWEIWIGTRDKLPRLMVVSHRDGERQPTFTVEFHDWKLDAPVSAQTFHYNLPKGAVKLQFRPPRAAQ